MSNSNPKDDALFEALGKSKKKKKGRIIRTVLIVVLVIAIALGAGVVYLRQQVQERFATTQAEVLTYEVTTGSISTLVSGSGTLTEVGLEQLTVPAGVQIQEVLVERNDTVEAGDVVARVELASVMDAMNDIQSQIDDLDEQISDAEADQVSSTVKSGVSGRVKKIYAESGTDVAACMVEHGALAVISLDGYMAVDIETEALAAGDTVTVTLADGTAVSGSVKSVSKGIATVLISDNGPEMDEEVSVSLEDGTTLGSGALYIHNPLKITGYAGTVSSVKIKENQKITASAKLFTLTDTEFSANYESLLRSRSDLEETLLELLSLYRSGGVVAPFSGSVNSVDYTKETEGVETAVVTLSPDKEVSITISVDESDILALELEQEVSVTVSSVSSDALTGYVSEINRTATTSSGVTVYSAVITLDKVEGMLPGMSASAEVRIEGVDDALIIPVDALHQTGTGAYVYTSYDEETQTYGGKVDVVTGLSNDDYVEIKSGLSQGDTVYYTESQDVMGFGNMGFSGMGNMTGDFGGQMPGSSSGGNSGGQMPDIGGNSGGQMPGGDRGSRG